MDGFIRRTEQKKTKILEVAKKKLLNETFKTSTIQEIAKEAIVSQVSIYNYFGSKDILLFEAVSSILDGKLARYYTLLIEDMDYPKLVSTIMSEEIALVKKLNVWMKQAVNVYQINEQIKEYQDTRLAPFLVALINKGIEEGFVSQDLTEREILFYFRMYQQAMAQSHEEQNPLLHVISEERLIQFFFYGLWGK
ncbi:TetR/AcrR family transcriptional regulator [Halalkalibacter urbisdiaboli]|uniref:TetR/AcrR family transcriptional regulator n=1 Tax=Halalkalibacter urbisdiaboli TaxID=1960589 RepID=UPI000B43F5B9|nr:TetR/AcrR family transcriptional regulator [Halalkalibacter urbisdiaboli]